MLNNKIFVALLGAFLINQSAFCAFLQPADILPPLSTEESLRHFRDDWKNRVATIMTAGGYTEREINALFRIEGFEITHIASPRQGVYTGTVLGSYKIATAENRASKLPVVLIPFPKKRPSMELHFPLGPGVLDYMGKRYAEQKEKDNKK
jgi:hypothetical protein